MSVRSTNKIELSPADVASLMEAALMPVDPTRLQLANFPPADVYLRYLARMIQLTIDPRARIVSTDFELIFRSLTFHGDDDALDQIESRLLFSTPAREDFRLAFHFANEEVLSVHHPDSADEQTIEELRARAGEEEAEPWAFAMLSTFPAALGDFFREAFEVAELFVYADASARYSSLVYDLGGTPMSKNERPPSRFAQRGLSGLLRKRRPVNPYRLAPLSPDELAAAYLQTYVTQKAQREKSFLLAGVPVAGDDRYDYVIVNPASGYAIGYRLPVLYAELINHTSAPPVWDAEWRAFIPANVEESLGIRDGEEINSWLTGSRLLISAER